MSETSEIPDYSYLEKFRDPKFPFVYWVEDKDIIPQVIKDVSPSGKYGLETGIGYQPTKLFNIDPGIKWLATETDPERYANVKKNLNNIWDGINPDDFPGDFKVIVLNTASTEKMVSRANVLVYRNLNYRNMTTPDFKSLKSGQRMVFIVNDTHINELAFYQDFLSSHGYNPAEIKVRSLSLPKLSFDYVGNKKEYVLDLVKE
ncbi:hypothetical protein COT75_03145 [Candidatus Beckwithbacteria bacterium CG10_big_fil_rev_8_21_14_0_10_34_10]|uniref:Uncharacterized protein n=1 Tax=Candidatus Beckwithbacteria bacterium CG10_big_fil_rev_8_21_14_0_10_34_10 TaxID=1974495 RepID=A0A2H0W973_9BACT|nr:MAG: hypothetical protein COT75_03145 [Candidatus Beckwithbacteria bacterium CG10_big_fil_rev_8_21_14_0_10_34_10]